ncbi:hypothetical protein [Butyrivibrio sp. NC2002]|uniref:hypothetical protein n=1 Tax=Butyrivibrio sp. NC2002 TaxID=1410610 RepID=UPI000567A215|nr:hypothetical protein [Butyrivibrio sp. NC2002]
MNGLKELLEIEKNRLIRIKAVVDNRLIEVPEGALNNMSENSYNEWIQYLKATAERPDLMGYSNHVVQIFIKN